MRQGPYKTVLGGLCFGNKGWNGNARVEGLEVKILIEEGGTWAGWSKGCFGCSRWDSSV